MPKPASPTSEDLALIRAVAEGLLRYRSGDNPSGKSISNKELAARLGVSPATITNLFGLLDQSENGPKHQRDLSGQMLLRVLKAGIRIDYGELQFLAVSSISQQIAFVFEDALPCEDTGKGIAVKIEKKGPASSALSFQIKLAG